MNVQRVHVMLIDSAYSSARYDEMHLWYKLKFGRKSVCVFCPELEQADVSVPFMHEYTCCIRARVTNYSTVFGIEICEGTHGIHTRTSDVCGAWIKWVYRINGTWSNLELFHKRCSVNVTPIRNNYHTQWQHAK